MRLGFSHDPTRCTHQHFIDGHHIKHWADGGETSLDNLVQLCRHHHRLVHEGGFDCERLDDGKIVFRDNRNEILPNVNMPNPDLSQQLTDNWMRSTYAHLEIDETSCVTKWGAGATCDWDMAVDNLFT